MKIGVMSDTHGHLDVMRRVASDMIDKYSVEAIVHLGDDSKDAEELSSLPVDIYWVPGVFEGRYKDPKIPNRIIREFEDVPFLLTHTPIIDSHDIEGDLDPLQVLEDGDVKVMLHGHSHMWRVDEERGVVIVNPGHLKPDEKKCEPSFAVLDVFQNRMDVKIYALSGELLVEKQFFFEL